MDTRNEGKVDDLLFLIVNRFQPLVGCGIHALSMLIQLYSWRDVSPLYLIPQIFESDPKTKLLCVVMEEYLNVYKSIMQGKTNKT